MEGPEAAASSVVLAVQRTAPPGMFHDELVERARRGIEFMTAFPLLVREDSPPWSCGACWPSSWQPSPFLRVDITRW